MGAIAVHSNNCPIQLGGGYDQLLFIGCQSQAY